MTNQIKEEEAKWSLGTNRFHRAPVWPEMLEVLQILEEKQRGLGSHGDKDGTGSQVSCQLQWRRQQYLGREGDVSLARQRVQDLAGEFFWRENSSPSVTA